MTSKLSPEYDLDKNEKEQSAIDQRLRQLQRPAYVPYKGLLLLYVVWKFGNKNLGWTSETGQRVVDPIPKVSKFPDWRGLSTYHSQAPRKQSCCCRLLPPAPCCLTSPFLITNESILFESEAPTGMWFPPSDGEMLSFLLRAPCLLHL